jgi:hypothetical protein
VFHQALGLDPTDYDYRVFTICSQIARQVFPVELDTDDPRFRRAMDRLLVPATASPPARRGRPGGRMAARHRAIGAAPISRACSAAPAPQSAARHGPAATGMVSWTGHVLPVLATILIWFFATGLVAWLDNRARHTFAHSLLLAGMAAIGGIVIIALAMQHATLLGVYASLAGAILIWAWHEISF